MRGKFDSELVSVSQWSNDRTPVLNTGDVKFKSQLRHKIFPQCLLYIAYVQLIYKIAYVIVIYNNLIAVQITCPVTQHIFHTFATLIVQLHQHIHLTFAMRNAFLKGRISHEERVIEHIFNKKWPSL